MSFCKGWAVDKLRKFVYDVQWQDYPRGASLVKQGQPSEFLYFLNTGECKVIINQIVEAGMVSGSEMEESVFKPPPKPKNTTEVSVNPARIEIKASEIACMRSGELLGEFPLFSTGTCTLAQHRA
jgi:CRP-like cAMP-binding protein